MPDKHEVGGSSPLGPTRNANAFRWEGACECLYSVQFVAVEKEFVKFSKHLSKIKCFENLMNN